MNIATLPDFNQAIGAARANARLQYRLIFDPEPFVGIHPVAANLRRLHETEILDLPLLLACECPAVGPIPAANLAELKKAAIAAQPAKIAARIEDLTSAIAWELQQFGCVLLKANPLPSAANVGDPMNRTPRENRKHLRTIGKRGRAILRTWKRQQRCSVCSGGRQLVIRRLDGQKMKTALVYGSVETILRYLTECCAICFTCQGRAQHGVTEDVLEQIREALRSFRRTEDICRELHTWKGTVAKLAEEMERNGEVCLCGKRLGHRGSCALVRMVRAGGGSNPPASTAPKPVAEIPANHCTADRACPFPPLRTGVCSFHLRAFAFPESMTDSKLDIADFVLSAENRNPLLSVVTRSQLQKPSYYMGAR